jgi:hypothetical protein
MMKQILINKDENKTLFGLALDTQQRLEKSHTQVVEIYEMTQTNQKILLKFLEKYKQN